MLPSKVAVISDPAVILNVALSPSSTSLLDKLNESLPSSSKDISDTDASVGASLIGLTAKVKVTLSDKELSKSDGGFKKKET